jgi:hypothetical protein
MHRDTCTCITRYNVHTLHARGRVKTAHGILREQEGATWPSLEAIRDKEITHLFIFQAGCACAARSVLDCTCPIGPWPVSAAFCCART